jgi:hypothetical protein
MPPEGVTVLVLKNIRLVNSSGIAEWRPKWDD